MSVCLIPVRTCTCHNRTFQTKHTNTHRHTHTHSMEQCGTHNATTWQLNITRAIKGNSIQLFLFVSSPPCSSRVFLFGLHQWDCDSAYCAGYPINTSTPPPPVAPHLSTMLGSAFLDSRSSTQRAIWSSSAEAVVLAMSTVQ